MYLLKTTYVEIIYKAKKRHNQYPMESPREAQEQRFWRGKILLTHFSPNGLRKNLVANLA